MSADIKPAAPVVLQFAPHLAEVKSTPDATTVAFLEILLDKAKAGHVRGVAVAAITVERTYVAQATGDAWAQRVLTRGALLELLDDLSRRGAARRRK